MIQCTFGMLLLNSFVGFQWFEDGTRTSIWSFRIIGQVFFVIGFVTSLLTYLGVLGAVGSIIILVQYFVINAICVLVYAISQVVLAAHTVRDMWALGNLSSWFDSLGDILLGLLFLMGSLVANFVFSNEICSFALHYVDGMFIGTTLTLLAVMMVYKFWDSITKDDLEFAIGGAPQIWHLQFEKKDKL